MRTSSFIGLIFLAAMLIVVSTPSLLNSTATGIETIGIGAGLVKDEQAEYDRALRRDAQSRNGEGVEPAEPELMLKAHVIDPDNGDLRDTVSPEVRESNQRGRLASGTRRALLPGQLANRDANSLPPVVDPGAFLRDDANCPRFEPWDPVAMWSSPETRGQWLAAAADAEDPGLCRQLLRLRVEQAREGNAVERADRRRLGTMSEFDSERLWLELMRIDLFAAMSQLDGDRVADARDTIRTSIAPPR